MRRDGDWAAVGILMAITTLALTLWIFSSFGIANTHGGRGWWPAVIIAMGVGAGSAYMSRRSKLWMNGFGVIVAIALGGVVIALIVATLRS